MAQVKAKTLMEKHGFLDKEKGTPEHDRIQKWVYKNAHKIIDELFVKGAQGFEIKVNRWEHEIIQTNFNNKIVVGFVDLFVQYLKENDPIGPEWPSVFFEIKTSIPSVGKLIRQLNFYRTHLGNKTFVVVCPDDSSSDILKE